MGADVKMTYDRMTDLDVPSLKRDESTPDRKDLWDMVDAAATERHRDTGGYYTTPNFICAQCKEGFHNLGSLSLHKEAAHEVPFTKTMQGPPPPPLSPQEVEAEKVGICEMCWTPLPVQPGSVWPQKCKVCQDKTMQGPPPPPPLSAEVICAKLSHLPPQEVEAALERLNKYVERVTGIRLRKKVVYISGPYRAATEQGVYENIQRARAAAMKYWKLGYAVICPHLNTAFMGGLGGSTEADQEMFISGDLEFVHRSDIIVMLPRWADSQGAVQELAEARRCDKEVVWEES